MINQSESHNQPKTPINGFSNNMRRFIKDKAYEIQAESLAILSFLELENNDHYFSLSSNQILNLNKIYSNAFLRFTFDNSVINEYIHTAVTTKDSRKLHYLFSVNAFALEDFNLRQNRLLIDKKGNQILSGSVHDSITTLTGRPQKSPISQLDIYQIASHSLNVSPITQSVSNFLLNLAEA
jgi:hypothetical protein